MTTRIQTDTHLVRCAHHLSPRRERRLKCVWPAAQIQDGISDKIPMSVSFIAMFFSGCKPSDLRPSPIR